MHRSYKGHKFILVVIYEVTIHLITIPIQHSRLENIEHGSIKYTSPHYMILDQESAFMSSQINYWFTRLIIRIKTVASYKNQSLQAQHGIKYLSTMVIKYPRDLG